MHLKDMSILYMKASMIILHHYQKVMKDMNTQRHLVQQKDMSILIMKASMIIFHHYQKVMKDMNTQRH